jgi:hypothetical protein
MAVGCCPVSIENRDGAQMGELQYAASKTTPVSASFDIVAARTTLPP